MMKRHLLKTLVAVVTASAMLFAACGKDDNEGGSSSRYTLTVQPNNPAWGTTTGSGTYNSGDRVDVEAVPASGYHFIKWSDGAVSNPRTVTVSSDITLYGLFSAIQDDPNPYNPEEGDDPNPDPEPTPEGWVDLGLPSGLLWATCNLGATSPEEYGNYYAWGEITPKSVYDWSTYRYGTVDGDGWLNTLTKYNTSTYYGTVDNLTTLLPEDDAATQVLGGGARIPTFDDWQELERYTTSVWITMNDVYGRKFTAANGNSIFLPADGSLDNAGSYGYYWSASLHESHPYGAWSFVFYSGNQGMDDSDRESGRSVRAVRASEN